ncbi:MAG: hypothetical protein LBR43_00905 [Spiroplasmataceae bacterium]|jgi:hypothetical protein|nr:hypothetical protein [Spiroplasmataceae bacterium]
MEANRKNVSEESISEEEEIFRYLESDECLGSKLLDRNATEEDKFKYNHCRSIVKYKVKNKLSLAEIANKLNLDKDLTNKLLHYHLENFSLRDIIDYAEKLKIISFLESSMNVGKSNIMVDNSIFSPFIRFYK